MSIGVLGPLALVWLCLHSTIASAQDQAFDDEGTLALRYSLKSSALMSRSPDDSTLFPERGTATGFWRGRVEPTWRWSNGITFELPALRYRQDKDQVIRQALSAETQDGRPAAIECEALEQLLGYAWPGNIRELRNVIRTALAICEGGVVTRMDLPREVRDADLPLVESLGQSRGGVRARSLPLRPLQAAERTALLQAIEDCSGNMTRVAARLGMSRNTLYRRMKRAGIPLGRLPSASRRAGYR